MGKYMGTIRERFLGHVYVGEDTCWHWISNINNDGYGVFKVGEKNKKAHRWSYEEFVGLIPAGLEIDHLCRNRRCVSPHHLEPVTKTENLRRGKWVRLDMDVARGIRAAFIPGETKQTDLARLVGVSKQCIGRVISGERWN